ncbi:endonuclease/exonuclease/phosphatase family protein [Vibrio sp. MA40-2]|uniref:endonuclease/exonuclease/phosphatase family protein n=1 Tax=Vibrio sp. MA40-2 TaxID=3391828 RepID=UPI0039A4735B
MTANKKVTFATANLFNFIQPPGAFYDFLNIYESDAWREKCRWTQLQVQRLDADIVALQEVFSIDAAKMLFEEIGFPYFKVVDCPHVEQEYIFTQPVVALASKYPITHTEAVVPPEHIEKNYQTSLPEFSRKPIYATVNIPEIGEIAVYVCHLKSQRATEANDLENDHSLIGKWLSSQQRGWEAAMLRVFMEQKYQKHPIPTVLMGDMNQPLTSDITGLLTLELEQTDKALRLQDSRHIFTKNNNAIEREPTHYHFGKGNVLDYVLLSQEFQVDSQYFLAEVVDYKVLNQHLINPIFERDRQASDHAFVAATVDFVRLS